MSINNKYSQGSDKKNVKIYRHYNYGITSVNSQPCKKPNGSSTVPDKNFINLLEKYNNNNQCKNKELSDGINNCKKKIDNLVKRIKTIENKLSNLLEINVVNNHIVQNKINVKIPKLSMDTGLTMEKRGNIIEINGSLNPSFIKICDLQGFIFMDKNKIKDINDIFGLINIYNIENGTIYSGIIYYDNDIKYILSNRPLAPLNVIFFGLINIMIKINLY